MTDVHKATASRIFHVCILKVTREQREFAKKLNFGRFYGISGKKFASLNSKEFKRFERKSLSEA